MAKLSHFNRLVKEFGSLADFQIVYIQEAHPTNGWAFRNNPFVIRDHSSMEERLEAARQLRAAQPACPIVVDSMEDVANFQYGALYERLYIILDGKVAYQGERGPHGYKLTEVEQWLRAFRDSSAGKTAI